MLFSVERKSANVMLEAAAEAEAVEAGVVSPIITTVEGSLRGFRGSKKYMVFVMLGELRGRIN